MRRIFVFIVALVLLFVVLGGGMALGGRAWWGDAGWYFPWNYSPAYRLRCGQEALSHSKFDRAQEVALRLEADGYQDQAALLRGESYFRKGRPLADVDQLSKALGEFQKIRDQGDIGIQAATYVGQCYLYLKQPVQAEAALRFVISRQPDNIEAHRGLAVLYHDQGAMGRAIPHLQKVAELDPQDGRPHRLLGLLYKDAEQFPEAVASYQQALSRNLPAPNREQDPATVRKELAECLVKQTKYDKALEVLQEFEPLTEDVPGVEALRGECLWALGRTEEARTVLDQALDLYPNSLELLRLRGRIYLADDNAPRAIELLQKALRLERHDYACLYQLSQAFEKLGKKVEADAQKRILDQTQSDLTELSRLDREVLNNPWDLKKRLRLADLCEKLDRADLAAFWRKAAAACPAQPTPEPTKSAEKQLEGNKQ